MDLLRTSAVVGSLVGVALLGFPAAAQESTSFRISRLTLSPAADVSSSTSFEARVSLGEEGPVGSTSFCNDGFVPALGFWSIRGDVSVPIVLRLSRQPAVTTVELSWTGAAPEFELYRSDMSTDVLDPVHLNLTTTACSATDSPPDTSDVFFYLVIPTN